jgi:outer membrane biosynthesis protein TonB
MRDGAILSGFLHGVIILLLFIGVPDFFRRDLEPPPVIPIEIMNIADLTQAPALKVKPKADTPKEEVKEKPIPPKPTPVAEKTPPEPEEKPDPKPEPEMTMEDLLAPIVEEKPKEEKPKEKPKPKKDKKKDKKKEKPKKKKKDFNSLLNNLDKTESSSEGKTQPEQDESSTADHAANNVSDVLSVTELDLIRRQLAGCWNVPAGARDGKDMYVDVKVVMNPDATVQSAAVTGASSSASAAAKDSARRAVSNPNCSPLKLPLDRYDQWKTITIRFDPQLIL